MLTPSERKEIHTGVIEKLLTEYPMIEVTGFPEIRQAEDDHSGLPRWEIPSLDDLILNLEPLPALTTVLGQCEDGLPLLFDLMDPTPGSILVETPEDDSNRLFLANFIRATTLLNRPSDVHYFLIRTNSDDFDALRSNHCQLSASAADRDSEVIVYALTELAERRRIGRGRGPVQCLVIEDLDEYLSCCNQESWIHLKWLIRHGAKHGIWVIAARNSQAKQTDNQRLAKEFRTRIYSAANPRPDWNLTDRQPYPSLSNNQFAFRFGSEWIHFIVPS